MRDSPTTALGGLAAFILAMFILPNGWEDGLLVVAVVLPTCIIVGIIRAYQKKGRK